jgi:hypothetical protein
MALIFGYDAIRVGLWPFDAKPMGPANAEIQALIPHSSGCWSISGDPVGRIAVSPLGGLHSKMGPIFENIDTEDRAHLRRGPGVV